MLKSVCLMSALLGGSLLSLPLAASAMPLGPSAVIAGPTGSDVQTVRMRHHMRSTMHRGHHRSLRRSRAMRPSGGHGGGTSTSSGAAGGAR